MAQPAQQPQYVTRRAVRRVDVPKGIVNNAALSARNLSKAGIMLASGSEPRIGAVIELDLQLGENEVALKAIVMWCQAARSIFASGYVMGARFVDVSTRERLLLRAYIDAISPASPR